MSNDISVDTLGNAPGQMVVGAVTDTAHVTPQFRRNRRAMLLTWLRKIHLYIGLWGAGLGLLFGGTGILLNHRAVMKIPVEKTIQTTAQLPLPSQAFVSPEQMSIWLQRELKFTPNQEPIIKAHPEKKIIWADREVVQPARWTISLHHPRHSINAEYFVGNRFVKLEQVDATPIGTLTRLHMSVGANAFWVLLADTLAGSLILLSLTGLLMWTQFHTVRTTAVLTSIGALSAATWYFWSI